MAVTDQQFLDHTNLNNAEFANRQVTIRGFGDPRILPGVVGVPGWYYLDDNTTPPIRYEKKDTENTDWELAGTGGGGSVDPHNHDERYYTETEIDALIAAAVSGDHNHDERYYTQAQVDAIISGVVGGTKVLGALPLELPNDIIEIFTLPNGDEYLEGSLEIYVNGLYEGVPTRISSTQFQVSTPPLEAGDIILCSYIKL